jgi:signal transduction histidine kinase
MLYEFIELNRDEIVRRCRARVGKRSIPPPTPAETDHGVPVFLNQLQHALRFGVSMSSEIGGTALRHGHDLVLQGFTVSQVVHDYGDVCQAITELAVEMEAPISTEDFRTLNRCLDDAIAGAVTAYARERTQTGIDSESAKGNERLGFFIHEMRNLISTASYAFEVLKTGAVGISGSTGQVLQRSLIAQRALIARSLTDIRLAQGVHDPAAFAVGEFIEEMAANAGLEADARGLRLVVALVEDATIEADRQVLSAVVMNLLQNAFKFTRPSTTVTLRVGASTERVLIEVQDECGGLPGANITDIFRPFEQRASDRSGLGLGLAFSRWAVEASGGRLYARNLTDRGCIFTIDLPRVQSPIVTRVT